MVDYGITRGGTITGPVTIEASAPAGGLLHVINTASAPSDHTVIVEGVNATDRAFGMLATGDTQDRHNMTIAGLHQWGSGADGLDTNLYRNAANSLTTDDFLAMNAGQSAGQFSGFGGAANAVNLGTPGGGVAIKEGSNARMGTLTLTGATPVVVANTSITATTRIFLTANAPGGTPGHFWVSARSAGVSFSVTGTAGDTSTLAYWLAEPA
jgi:hypothetical protein